LFIRHNFQLKKDFGKSECEQELFRFLLHFRATNKFRRVKLSVKSDYAARAVLWLCRHYQEGVARKVEEMGTSQGIPPKYLVQILSELKAQQIVKSVRGKEGGYLLGKPPAEITLGDVIRCVEGQILDSSAITDPQCPAELRDAWKNIQRATNAAADAITFQQLLDDAADKAKMYYI